MRFVALLATPSVKCAMPIKQVVHKKRTKIPCHKLNKDEKAHREQRCVPGILMVLIESRYRKAILKFFTIFNNQH